MKCIYCGTEFNTTQGLFAHQDSCFYKENPIVIESEIIEEKEVEIIKKSKGRKPSKK